MMIRRLFFLCILSTSCVWGESVFTDLASWQQAAESLPNMSVTQEAFSEGLSAPDITVHTWDYPANPPDWYAQDGGVNMGTNGHFAPYLAFNQPVYGFIADFSEQLVGGGLVMYPGMPGPYAQGINVDGPTVGFVSTVQITMLTFGNEFFDGQQFWMGDVWIATDPPADAPEPASWELVLCAACAVGIWGKRRPLRALLHVVL